jgi:putative heme-binding domain-containing protein
MIRSALILQFVKFQSVLEKKSEMQNSDSTPRLTGIRSPTRRSTCPTGEPIFGRFFGSAFPGVVFRGILPMSAISLVLAWGSCCFATRSLAQTNSADVQVPPGFVVTRVADNQLCPDIFRLAISPAGDVYASGPGYLRRLIDRNQDGIFDSSLDLPEGPQTGAQGLYCGEDSILAVADGGVWEYGSLNDIPRDSAPAIPLNQQPRLKRMSIDVGGEHQAHAIKRGPDGWYYLIAGNHTTVQPEFFSGAHSPVRTPRAGFLMRMAPDFRTSEIVAHGFRNPYDFDFLEAGEFLVYDSDGERDIFLPWYRPTRLFRVRAGDDAGWFDEGWKRPSEYFDMPTQVVALGRGSPTAVVRYRGTQFPPEYQQAILLGDWTFGRVIVVKPEKGRLVTEDFARSLGNSGLAVTDLVIDRDGSLLVSVGGRGTTGSIYRISYSPTPLTANKTELESGLESELETELETEPESTHWQLPGKDPLYQELERIARIRGAWKSADWQAIVRILTTRNEAGESRSEGWRNLKATCLSLLVGRSDWPGDPELSDQLINGLESIGKSDDPELIRFLPQLSERLDPAVGQRLREQAGSPLAAAAWQIGRNLSPRQKSELISELLFQLLQQDLPSVQRRAMCRMAQKLVGDPGLAEVPTVFRGYLNSGETPEFAETELEGRMSWPEDQAILLAHQLALGIELALDAADFFLATEIARLATLMRISSPELVALYARQIDQASDPVLDIHWLICLALSAADHWTALPAEDKTRVILQLASLDQKQRRTGGEVERNWGIRLAELLEVLNRKVPELQTGLLDDFEGRTGQLFLMEIFRDEHQDEAIEKILRHVNRNPQLADPEHLKIILSTGSLRHQDFFRQAASLPRFQELGVLALTRWPQEQDRTWYRFGLSSQNLTLVKESAIALRRLEEPPLAEDLVTALFAARRLGWTSPEVSVRDQLLLMMGRESDALIPYRFQRPNLVQESSLKQWADLLGKKYPDVFSGLLPEPSDWQTTFQNVQNVDWEGGDRLRGSALYSELRCAQCHGSIQALGPPLTGIAQRFSREDLFRTIAEPDRKISDRYRATVLETVDGKIYRGLVIYQSVDGVTLQDSQGQTVRLERDSIERQTPSDRSLMPSGLLQGLTPQQYADLWSYLRQL